MLQGYLKLLQVEFQTTQTYRATFFFWIVGALLRSYFLVVFWIAVYGNKQVIVGVALPTMVTYATLSSIQLNYFLYGSSRWRMQERIRQGNIVIDLLRPYHFLLAMFAADLGELLSSLPLAGIALIIASLLGVMGAPSSPIAGIMYLFSLLLSFILNFLMITIVGLLAFWTFELSGIDWMFNLFVGFLSGALIPPWLLPSALQQLMDLLPFLGIVYLPVAIYVGRVSGLELYLALLQQLLWIVGLMIFALWLWKKAQHKLLIQGG